MRHRRPTQIIAETHLNLPRSKASRPTTTWAQDFATMLSKIRPKHTKTPGIMLLSSKQTNFQFFVASLVVATCILLTITSTTVESAQSIPTTTIASPTIKSSGTTQAYGEPIKWSFGGWAPLNGMPGHRGSNGTAITSPLPQKPTPKPSIGRQATNTSIAKGERGIDAMNESASYSHKKIQFATPPITMGYNDNNSNNRMPDEGHNQRDNRQVHPHLQHGPAYAMQPQNLQNMGPAPMQFSPPAPTPIVRDHILPAANQHQVRHQHQAQMQQYGPHPMQPARGNPMQQPARPPMDFVHFQQMQQRHRQQMMHHHHNMAMQHQQHMRQQQHLHPMQMHGPHPPMNRAPYNMEQRPQMLSNEIPRPPMQQLRSIPRYPGSPPILHPQQQTQMKPNIEPPALNTFKLIEGEQPIMFSHSLSNEHIPMLEVNGGRHPQEFRNVSELAQPQQQQHEMNQQQQQQQSSTPSAEQLYAPNLAAIEKDNLNYHNVLQQVSNSLAAEQSPSNNIQDIKQKQQYEQQQQQQQQQEQQEHPGKTAGSKPSYLTIPVAVETEGDKVLTKDDINEIEKHVINVLPNLKTADKIVKLADAHLNLGNLKAPQESGQQQQQSAVSGPADLHEQNYQEHRSTMKQLENDLIKSALGSINAGPTEHNNQHSSRISGSQHGQQANGGNYGTGSASTSNPQHRDIENPPRQHHQLDEQHYFIATGPMQEIGTVDPDQFSDYNLIKNDLLTTFRYEPTRSNSQQSTTPMGNHNQQTSSTPPMPPTPNKMRGPSVTRYFQQGTASTQAQGQNYNGRGNTNSGRGHSGLFGRIRGNQQQTATTKTILGGRKVSEVMRPLLHTTPVPMTTPMHMQSVEPEKVDAIQLIAGHRANDKQPMVVEAHQLVSHTPDGGIDYNSGAQMQQQPQQPQQQHQQQNHQMQNNNQTVIYEAQQENPLQQQHQQMQYSPQDENQGAIIEYVALTDQALSNAISSSQQQSSNGYDNNHSGQQQHQEQQVYSTPEQQQQPARHQQQEGDTRAPFSYDYTMTTQHQHQQSTGPTNEGVTQPTTYVTMSDPALIQAVQQHQSGEAQPSLAWSPSVASEHQQQQMELSGHAGPMQQMEMPATAGYNFFNQEPQQQQQTIPPPGQQQQQTEEYQQQQQQQHEQPQNRWRSKAGGSQPNPDAQYDGQIVKADQQQESSPEDSSQQQRDYSNQIDLNRLAAPESRPQQENIIQQQVNEHENGFQSQQQQYQDQSSSTPSNGEQQTREPNYMSTNSYSAGAQINHSQKPSNGNYEEQRQQYENQGPQTQSMGQYSYMKLDQDRQQNHLAQQQAQHQVQLAEMISDQPDRQQQQQQQQYQTTTPMTLTTLAAIEDQQQQQQQQQQEQDTQQQQMERGTDPGTGNGAQNANYMVEQVESRPSVQSQPESLIVNESPMQVPILDQQSLISDPNLDSVVESLTSDDGGKQRQQPQPAGAYQVYQAYYAPKDHKPLPGYVRLTLEEFNDLFRDAEIQYVDRNLNNLANQQAANNNNNNKDNSQQMRTQNSYDHNLANDQMRASSSEVQSILVDGRSISPSERRSSPSTNSTIAGDTPISSTKVPAGERKTKLGQAVKKIISIRDSRQLAKQTSKNSKLVMKRIKSQQQSITTSSINPTTVTTTPTNIPTTSSANVPHEQSNKSSKQRLVKKKTTEMPKKAVTAT